jgi:hypothetical protein
LRRGRPLSSETQIPEAGMLDLLALISTVLIVIVGAISIVIVGVMAPR